MDVRGAQTIRPEGVLPVPWSGPGAPLSAHPATSFAGATLIGEAIGPQGFVRIALWLDDAGRVRQARARAPEDAAVRSCAEALCDVLEAGGDPRKVGADDVRGLARSRSVAGLESAELVLSALHAALALAVR